ncbi:cyanoexosortase C [Phormidesmis sp. 146-33]
MQWQTIVRNGPKLLKYSIKTPHHCIVTFGVLVGACYFPTWFSILWRSTLNGSPSVLLNAAFIYLGVQHLWQQRSRIKQLRAAEDDRVIGYLMILGGAGFFPFCRFSSSLEAFICMLVLVGIVLSTWGSAFLLKYRLPAVLLLASLYADYVYLSSTVWRLLTPLNMLENGMAWFAGLALRAIGQPAVSLNDTITLPTGGVQVLGGCSGFDMAITLAFTGLVLGLFLKLNWLRTIGLIGFGITLALLTNIPRIVLLTFASVYWGKASFEFWHGPIGGQIFSGVLFTLYYYLIMWMLQLQPRKSRS